MNTALKIALLAGGLYFLFREQIAAALWPAQATAPPIPVVTNPPVSEPPQPAPASPQVPPAPAVVPMPRQLEAAANVAQGSGMTFDQWNHYAAQIQGRPGPPIEEVFPGRDRAVWMSADQYWSGRQAAGLAGLRGLPSVSRAWGF